MAWPISERTAYDELAELANMSALARWLQRWQPIAIHSAILAGARMENITGALENSMQVGFDRWHEWASQQRDFISAASPASPRRSTRPLCGGSLPSESRSAHPWRCRVGRVGSDYPLTVPDGGAEPTEEAR
jgi:hypothetical protein